MGVPNESKRDDALDRPVDDLEDDDLDDPDDAEGEFDFLRIYNHEFEELGPCDQADLMVLLEVEDNAVQLLRQGQPPQIAVVNALGRQQEGASEADFHEIPISYDEPESWFGFLDLGIVSAVGALRLLGAMPFASCNGGRDGGMHRERFPLVAYLGSTEVVERVGRIASDLKMDHNLDSGVGAVLFADTIEDMLGFARRVARDENAG